MKVHIVDCVNYLNNLEKRVLQKQIKLILKNLKITGNKDICVTLLDDKEMRKLNITYRGIRRTTDVLSFPQNGPDPSLFGDIVISIDTAKRHARLYNKSIMNEIIKLIIHGVLHILGYDHKKKNDAIKMRVKEKELLFLINFD
jgi:probable rRNA maturation factor